VKVTKLDAEQRGLLSVGITGVVGVGFSLYALVVAAFGVSYLTDGTFSDLTSKAIAGAFLVAATAVIGAELVISAAAIRMTFTGVWPGRPVLFGRPAAAIGVAALALTAVLAVVL
jgi:hypothetical protein